MADEPKPQPEKKAKAAAPQGADKKPAVPGAAPAPTQDKKQIAVSFSQAVPARVEEILGRAGARGEAIQVRCKILDGEDKGKAMRRNVKGPVRIGDMLMLRETEIEAQKLMQSRG